MAWIVVIVRSVAVAIVLVLSALVGAASAGASVQRDRVDHVVDGDTVRLAGLGRVRLIGVDTPEVYFKTECYGRQASDFTKRLLPPGTPVTYRFDVERRDRYGRALAYLYKGSTFVNAELVRRGYAVPLTIPPNVRYAHRFVALSRAARIGGRGLWAAGACATPAPPANPATSGDKDCSDFSSQAEAQRYYEAKGGPAVDPDRLDGDHDGKACDSLS
jgi:micrococcal nuclease